jgi:hypothetical protein
MRPIWPDQKGASVYESNALGHVVDRIPCSRIPKTLESFMSQIAITNQGKPKTMDPNNECMFHHRDQLSIDNNVGNLLAYSN